MNSQLVMLMKKVVKNVAAAPRRCTGVDYQETLLLGLGHGLIAHEQRYNVGTAVL